MTDYSAGAGTAGTYTLSVTQGSQNIAANTSSDSWSLTLYCGNHSSYSSGVSWSVTIDGNNYSGTFSFDFRGSTSAAVASGSTTVTHAPDGTKSTGVSFSTGATGTSGIGSGSSGGGTFVQTTIPRATQPTVSPTYGDTGTSFTIGVVPASSAFYHDIYYSLDGGTTYTSIVANLVGTTTSQAWTPATTLLPNTSSATAIIKVDTRSSSGGTIIGTKTVSLPLTVNSSVVPTISSVAWADAQTSSPDIPTLMGGTGRYVQGWSLLNPTVASAGASGSTIASCIVSTTAQTTPSGTPFSLPIALSGSVPYSAIATDSRGRNSTTYTNTVAVTAYAFPSLPTPTVTRTSDAAGLIPSPTGTYIAITPTASVSSLNFSGEKNLLEWQVRTKPVGGSWTTIQAWTSATVSGTTWTTPYVAAGPYASSGAWVVEVSIRDLFGKNGYNTGSTIVVLTVNVPSESVAFDWDRGLGIGIGKYRANGTVDINGDTYTSGVFYQGSTSNPVLDSGSLATDAQAIAGTDTTHAVTPHGLAAAVGARIPGPSVAINSRFRCNQYAYVSGAALAPGQFAVDRWRDARVTNQGLNPRAAASTAFWYSNNATLSRLTGLTIPGLPGVTTAFRGTVSSAAIAGLYVPSDNTSPYATVGGGKSYTISVWLRTSIAITLNPNAQFYTAAGGPLGSITSPAAVSLAANTWTFVSWLVTPGAAYPTAGRMGPYWYSNGSMAVGSTFDATGLTITEGSYVYPFFDGDMSECSWSGTQYLSASYSAPNATGTALTFTPDPHGQTVTLAAYSRIQQPVEQSKVTAGLWTMSIGGTSLIRAYNKGLSPASRPAFSTTGTFTATFDGTDDVILEVAANGATATTVDMVKFEPGASATPYQPQAVEAELAQCQRYYWQVTANNGANNVTLCSGGAFTSGAHYGPLRYPVAMRVPPVFQPSSASAIAVFGGGVAANSTAVSCDTINTLSVRLNALASGFTAGWGVWFEVRNTCWVAFDAEMK